MHTVSRQEPDHHTLTFCLISGVHSITYAISYAKDKAIAYSDQGGPALLYVYIPKKLADLAIKPDHEEYLFEPGVGLSRLQAAWPALVKFAEHLSDE